MPISALNSRSPSVLGRQVSQRGPLANLFKFDAQTASHIGDIRSNAVGVVDSRGSEHLRRCAECFVAGEVQSRPEVLSSSSDAPH